MTHLYVKITGLQNHMATNPFVHELLDIDAVAANMSALELKEDSILHRRSRAKNVLVQTRDKDVIFLKSQKHKIPCKPAQNFSNVSSTNALVQTRDKDVIFFKCQLYILRSGPRRRRLDLK